MNLTKNIVAATLVAATMLGVAPAAQAQASSSISISYRDNGYRGGWRDDRRRNWDRDRDGIPNRYDRRPYRYDYRGWGWNNGYRYRDNRRCWTEWRYDPWRDDRVPVRFCR